MNSGGRRPVRNLIVCWLWELLTTVNHSNWHEDELLYTQAWVVDNRDMSINAIVCLSTLLSLLAYNIIIEHNSCMSISNAKWDYVDIVKIMLSENLSNTHLTSFVLLLFSHHSCNHSLCWQRETAAGENSRVAGGDATEQPRQRTNHMETMTDPPGCLTEHQSNAALLALHSSALCSGLHSLIKQC